MIQRPKVGVLGDKLTDFIMVRDQNEKSDKSPASMSFTQEHLTQHITSSGTHTLQKVFEELRDQIEVLPLGSTDNETAFAEWYVGKEKNSLFLKEYFGIFDNVTSGITKEKALQETDIENIRTSDIITIYNMNNLFNYCMEQNLTDINDTTLILFRTKFTDGKKSTKFFKLLYDLNHQHSTKLANQTILLLKAAELRDAGFNIQKSVSWEQLAIRTMYVFSSQ